MIECSDCDQMFDNLEYWDHDCDGNATLNADFFVMENDNG
jgi:hypothetical protein